MARSTFVSELQAAISATDTDLMLGLTWHETNKGPVSLHQGMQLRDEGGSSISIRICVDAMSIFSALSVDCVTPPAEKSLYCHLL